MHDGRGEQGPVAALAEVFQRGREIFLDELERTVVFVLTVLGICPEAVDECRAAEDDDGAGEEYGPLLKDGG